ncbi:MAG TPA: hypothetical protein VGD41_08950 [Pyrinomonadaceae bacterium]
MKSIVTSASSSGDFGGIEKKMPFVKITNWARLRSIYLGLTLMQRQQLRVIANAGSHALNTTVTAELIALGLVRRDGDATTATEDGHYVANLSTI